VRAVERVGMVGACAPSIGLRLCANGRIVQTEFEEGHVAPIGRVGRPWTRPRRENALPAAICSAERDTAKRLDSVRAPASRTTYCHPRSLPNARSVWTGQRSPWVL